MKKVSGLILAGIFGISVNLLHGQIPCTNPQSPVLNFVSVNTLTGETELQWSKSLSAQVVAYIVHKFRNGIRTPVDTIWDPDAVRYLYKDVETKYYSLSYAVSSLRLPDCESPLSNSISTIFLSSFLDSCNRQISIKWNNYPDIPVRVMRYEVLASAGNSSIIYNAGLATELVIRDFLIGAEYFFSVRAILESGKISSSANDTLHTDMTRPPAWINADFATVNDEGKIHLSFSVGNESEINLYRLERKEGFNGVFRQVQELQAINYKVTYTDEKASADKINFYRLSAINNCNIPVIVSNLSSNITLALALDRNEIKLLWNRYHEFRGSLSGYRILMDAGNGYSEISFVADTMYTLSYSDIMNSVTGGRVCFRIAADESANPYGLNGESLSSSKCLEAVEVVTVPDLFTPDGDAINDYFKPVLSFIPSDYHLMITDIRGKKIFESRNHDVTWNGSSNGNQLPAGVYLWFLKITGPSGKAFTRNGTVTIFRSH